MSEFESDQSQSEVAGEEPVVSQEDIQRMQQTAAALAEDARLIEKYGMTRKQLNDKKHREAEIENKKRDQGKRQSRLDI
jgi:hypothetical protein